jgi:hypothetical protein
MVKINFVCELGGPYGNIVLSIIDPIREHIPNHQISGEPIPDAINVFFFIEEDYKKKAQQGLGINVYIDHGISDKLYRSQLDDIIFYDFMCVTGPLWEEKISQVGFPSERIITIGYPRLDPIFQGKMKKEQVGQKRILWAPTHSNSISTFPLFKQYINQFPSDITISSSLHPFNKSTLQTTMQELVDADIVISDSSSIIYEAWAIGKPVIFPDWIIKEAVLTGFPNSFESQIYKEGIGYHARDFEELLKLTYYALEHGLDEKAESFIEGIFPKKYRGCSGKIAASELRNLKRCAT